MATQQATTIRGVIRAIEGEVAIVEVEQGGCGRCHEEGGCGGQQLTQMFCSGPKTYRVDNPLGFKVGEKVTIGVAAGSVRKTANLAYGVPLVAAILGALVGRQIGGDVASMLGALGGLTLSFYYIRLRSRQASGETGERPQIISRS